VGRLFREFGIVVAGAVLISAFVSLSLTPVLNIYLTKKNVHKHSWFYTKSEPFFRGLESGYKRWLEAFMRKKWIAFVIVAVCMAIIYFVGSALPSELAPMEDRNRLRASVVAPEGTDFDYMDKVVYDITQTLLDSVDERNVVLSFAPGFGGGGGANNATISMGLVDAGERKRSQNDIAQNLNKIFKDFSNVFNMFCRI
jgi:multidrug efflux pump